ncbi:Transposase DDE domain protein [Streptomyces fradiae ATCC 10745 = DSM 40063]|uniref:Transposase DDE domain protein n=1 Tax=Streptomyces fradiae ATCC 10745 = DSM 40063 TaxID=1319510 RepID=A0A1Y2NNG5_STRFR|nr:Transposase DDE domain protein [Streptomyces fradiae ATCC 10745 = DSM 40063]
MPWCNALSAKTRGWGTGQVAGLDSVNLKTLLGDVASGRLQLPRFQRDWKWDDDRIRRRFLWRDRSSNRASRIWLSGWCRTSCGCCFGGWCRRRRSYVRKVAAAVGRVTVRPWQRSSSWLPRAAPGGSCHRCSVRAGRRSTGASPNGPEPASGPGSTVSFSTNSVPAASWTGRGALSTPSASRPQGGPLTGPNPTDRGKLGSKTHLITDRNGLPLSLGISGANMHDSQGLEPLVRGIPPIRSRRGPRRRRPAKLHADKGYDYDHLRRWLRKRGIRHRIARRGIESSQRLGRHRWVVERTVSWLAGCRRLHRRCERKPEHFLAVVGIAATLICHRRPGKT